METVLDGIIGGILSTNTERIRESTEALRQAFKNPQTLLVLCRIMVSPRETEVRQLVAVLLNRRLRKQRSWLLVPPEDQAVIKIGILQALIGEQEKIVRNVVGQLIGTLAQHEAAEKNSWLNELLAFTYQHCSMADPKKSELGAFLFSKLAEATPDLFTSRMTETLHLFTCILMAAQAYGDMATPTVANMIKGMCYLIPAVEGLTAAEQMLANAVPLTLSALQSFAQKYLNAEFTNCFDTLDSIVEYVPKLLNQNLKYVVHFCLQMMAGYQIDTCIRMSVLNFVQYFVRIKKRMIIKQNLLEPIVSVIVEMICSDSDFNDTENEYFSGTGNTPGASATNILDIMACHIPSEKMLGLVLPLIETALHHVDAVRRRGGFMCMGVISEGCSEAIKRKYLEIMVNIIIQRGVVDHDFRVRNAAFFAIGQFSENMQPEVSEYAMQILPVLFDLLHQLMVDIYLGKSVDHSYMRRIFYALEVFCENLADKIVPYLPKLMERLFECMDERHTVRMRQLALASISAVANASETSFMPYFDTAMDILQQYLVYECTVSMNELRIQAIDTLSAICCKVGSDNFMPCAQDTVQFSVNMLEQGPDDPDLRRAVYSLLAAMSNVMTEDMDTVFTRVLERIMETVVSTEHDTDNEQEDDSDDEDSWDDLDVENDYVYEKVEAILALKEFAVNSIISFSPHLTNSLFAVYKNIDHGQKCVREASVKALCAFVNALDTVRDKRGVRGACDILMPKFSDLIKNDQEHDVVWVILDELRDLFRAIRKGALHAPEPAEAVVDAIENVLLNKIACQLPEPSGGGGGDGEIVSLDTVESELDEMIAESACNLVATMGMALDPDSYSMYFGRLYPLLMAQLDKAKRNDEPRKRSAVYGVLSECINTLGMRVATHFDALCPVLLDGTNDCESDPRMACFCGLGELVYTAKEKSFGSYTVILQALSNEIAKNSTDATVLDDICGVLARLIITNCNLVPLDDVLPVFMSLLPIRNDTDENGMVLDAFRVLYMNARPSVVVFVGEMVSIIFHVLLHEQFDDDKATARAITFLKEIKHDFPDHINNLIGSCMTPAALTLLQKLFN
ncbi:importin-4-like [Drosophila obscura]|uniref:importin-4-like n=1 Tax=Drosophila obscura TaxID=7282 RepID=UPI001BB0F628|nr:importin-4-like [Drosophila obscura]